MAHKFVIVGTNDNPIYELDVAAQPKEAPHLAQFMMHSALDLVDEAKAKSKEMFLRTVDRSGKYTILAWVTAGNVKLLLSTEKPDADVARNFFTEVYETYLKILLNPFYQPSTPITSVAFDAKVKRIAQRYFS